MKLGIPRRGRHRAPALKELQAHIRWLEGLAEEAVNLAGHLAYVLNDPESQDRAAELRLRKESGRK